MVRILCGDVRALGEYDERAMGPFQYRCMNDDWPTHNLDDEMWRGELGQEALKWLVAQRLLNHPSREPEDEEDEGLRDDAEDLVYANTRIGTVFHSVGDSLRSYVESPMHVASLCRPGMCFRTALYVESWTR